MKKILFLSAVVGLLLTSCMKDDTGEKRERALAEFEAYITELENSGVELNKTDNGVYYEIIENGTSEPPEIGDLIEAEVTAKIIEGNIYFTTSIDTAEKYHIVQDFLYGPYRFFYGYGFTFGFHDGLGEIGAGGEMNIYVPTDMGYDYVDIPSVIPPFSNLLYQVKIKNIASDPDLFEQNNLHEYLESQEISVEDSTQYGIYFQWLEESEGDTVKLSDVVTIKYKGSFLDGRVFDETDGDNTITVNVNQFIPGFTAGLLEMKEGSKARFIIPYKYAYGANPQSNSYFPPYATLIFEVEVVEIG